MSHEHEAPDEAVDAAADDCATGDVTCMEALERIYDFMDGELSAAESAQIEAHFRKCARCWPHLKLEENFRDRVRAAVARPSVPDRVRNRIMEILATDPDEGG